MESLYCIQIPKSVRIRNKRLGLLLLLLRCGALAAGIAQLIVLKSWLVRYKPEGSYISVWSSPALPDSIQTNCVNATEYYHLWSPSWVFAPNRCEEVDPGRAAFKETTTAIFFPTFIRDDLIWKDTGGTSCGALTKTRCESMGGTYASTAGDCSCFRRDELLVKHLEESKFTFKHGFTVAMDDEAKTSLTGHARLQTFTQAGWGVSDIEVAGGIRTIIYNRNNEVCRFGGKDVFLTEDVQQGLQMTIREILECVGLELDMQYDELKSNHPLENKVPHLRSTGSQIVVRVTSENAAIHGESHGDVLCKIVLEDTVMWNSRTSVNYIEFPSPSSNNSVLVNSRYYGIGVSMEVGGTFGFFSPARLLGGLLGFAVLLALPTKVIMFIALSLLGFLSKLYRRMAIDYRKVSELVPGSLTRIAMHVGCFKELSSGKGSMNSKDFAHLIDFVCTPYIANGVLSDKEVRKLASFVFSRFDGKVDAHEWARKASDSDCIPLEDISNLFDEERRESIGERIFADESVRIAPANDLFHIHTHPANAITFAEPPEPQLGQDHHECSLPDASAPIPEERLDSDIELSAMEVRIRSSIEERVLALETEIHSLKGQIATHASKFANVATAEETVAAKEAEVSPTLGKADTTGEKVVAKEGQQYDAEHSHLAVVVQDKLEMQMRDVRAALERQQNETQIVLQEVRDDMRRAHQAFELIQTQVKMDAVEILRAEAKVVCEQALQPVGRTDPAGMQGTVNPSASPEPGDSNCMPLPDDYRQMSIQPLGYASGVLRNWSPEPTRIGASLYQIPSAITMEQHRTRT